MMFEIDSCVLILIFNYLFIPWIYEAGCDPPRYYNLIPTSFNIRLYSAGDSSP